MDQCEDWNCTFGQNSFRWGGCLCVSKESVFKAQNTALSACYKVILFFLQDERPRYWYPIPGGQRRAAQDEKQRIERLRPCLANTKMALTGCRIMPNFRAVSCCSLCSQAETPSSHPPAEEEVHSCSLPQLPLQARSYFIWGQRNNPCVSITCTAHRIWCGEGAAVGQPGLHCCPKQGCAQGGDELKGPLGPALAEGCTDRASCGRDHSFIQASPGESTWRSKKLIDQGFLIFPFLFPVSCVVPYLAYALGSPGVSEPFITAGKAPQHLPRCTEPPITGTPSQKAPVHWGSGFKLGRSRPHCFILTVSCCRFLSACWWVSAFSLCYFSVFCFFFFVNHVHHFMSCCYPRFSKHADSAIIDTDTILLRVAACNCKPQGILWR